ncbi:MAG: hypothetical protein ABJO67_03745 [Pseudoruegeria sp.]
MSTMKFTKISTAFHDNPKWRQLEGERDARLAFWGVITGSRINYTGFYYCRLGAFASDNMFTEEEVLTLFETLQKHGLIEYDNSTGWLRVIGWYYGEYAPKNKSETTRRANFFLTEDLPMTPITNNAIAEFVVGTLRRAACIDLDSHHPVEIYSKLADFVKSAVVTFDGLLEHLQREFHSKGNYSGAHLQGVGVELLKLATMSASAPLLRPPCEDGADRVSLPCDHPVAIVPPQREREKEKEERKPESSNGSSRPLLQTLNSRIAIKARSQ